MHQSSRDSMLSFAFLHKVDSPDSLAMKDQLDVGLLSRRNRKGLVSLSLQRSICSFPASHTALSSALTHIRLSCRIRGNTGFPLSVETSTLGWVPAINWEACGPRVNLPSNCTHLSKQLVLLYTPLDFYSHWSCETGWCCTRLQCIRTLLHALIHRWRRFLDESTLSRANGRSFLRRYCHNSNPSCSCYLSVCDS